MQESVNVFEHFSIIDVTHTSTKIQYHYKLLPLLFNLVEVDSTIYQHFAAP